MLEPSRTVIAASEGPVARATAELDARVERVLATRAGHVLVFGWMADESGGAPQVALIGGGGPLEAVPLVLMRHARSDVEAARGGTQHDFGFCLLAKFHLGAAGRAEALSIASNGRACHLDIHAEQASERRLLQELLAFLGVFQAHGGRETTLSRFLTRGARSIIDDLHHHDQRRAVTIQHTEQYGSRRHGPSFMTVLFGSVEAAMFQPLLFAKAGIDFGEWVYTCNSPEQADNLLRVSRTAAKLHNLPIRVVILSGNAGFGGANNTAIGTIAGNEIVLVNPDVYPMRDWAPLLNRATRQDRFSNKLRGGLLFYDDEMLMHGGMYLEEDTFVAGGPGEDDVRAPCRLLRVEHYDKGVPFIAENWSRERPVPAVTGAVMAFDRAAFESIGGFSDDFVYGHYEDADLCLRWADRIGPVEVDPDIRLVHLEGQGSRTRLPHFHGAAIVNRHIFDARNRHFAEADRAPPDTAAPKR